MDRALDEISIGRRHRHDFGDIKGLAASIEQIGLLHPIVVRPDGKLICGERRFLAFKELGRKSIPVRVVDIEELVFGEQAENIERKDFTVEERAAIGAAIEKLLGTRRGRPGKTSKILDNKGIKTEDIAAGKAGFKNGETYRQAKAVIAAAKANPEAFGKALADMNRTGRVNGPFKRVKVATQAEAIKREPPPLPHRGPYRVIAVDPPWPYEVRKEDPSHRATHPYPQMSIEQISALAVPSIAHDDVILWLWTTNHHMRESYAVLDAWGFESKTILTWVKDRMGTGDWLRGQSEHCHLATRGKPSVVLTNQTTVLHGPMRTNSEKPEEFYSFVEKLCPAPRYAELFQRREREGWDGHGDEIKRAS